MGKGSSRKCGRTREKCERYRAQGIKEKNKRRKLIKMLRSFHTPINEELLVRLDLPKSVLENYRYKRDAQCQRWIKC